MVDGTKNQVKAEMACVFAWEGETWLIVHVAMHIIASLMFGFIQPVMPFVTVYKVLLVIVISRGKLWDQSSSECLHKSFW